MSYALQRGLQDEAARPIAAWRAERGVSGRRELASRAGSGHLRAEVGPIFGPKSRNARKAA
jgi:hypothetical protein